MFPKQIETYFQDVIDFETLHNFEVSHFFDPFSDVAKKTTKRHGVRPAQGINQMHDSWTSVFFEAFFFPGNLYGI